MNVLAKMGIGRIAPGTQFDASRSTLRCSLRPTLSPPARYYAQFGAILQLVQSAPLADFGRCPPRVQVRRFDRLVPQGGMDAGTHNEPRRRLPKDPDIEQSLRVRRGVGRAMIELPRL